MSAAESVYRLLLRAYPPEFRGAYGSDMALLYRDLRREGRGRGVRFWAEMVWDVVRSAPALRLEACRRRWGIHTQFKKGEMMTMAILAILVGAMEAVNALTEVWAGGRLGHGRSLVEGTMGVVAGVLVLSAGIALLRRSPGAVVLARSAAVACLAVFVLIGLVMPLISYFGTWLGIGFPVVMLLFLQWAERRRAGSEPEPV